MVLIVLLCESVYNVLMAFLFLQSFPSCLGIVLQAQVCIWNHFVQFSFHLVLFAATFAVWFTFFSYAHHRVNGSLTVSGLTDFLFFLLFGLHNMILILLLLWTLTFGMFMFVCTGPRHWLVVQSEIIAYWINQIKMHQSG